MDYNENIYQLLINNNNKNIDKPENKQLHIDEPKNKQVNIDESENKPINIDESLSKKSNLKYNTITLSQTIELLSSCC